MALEGLYTAIEETGLGTAIRESGVLFPMLESAHVVFITFVLGSIAAIDLRLLGLSARSESVTAMSNALLPWTWGAFVGAAATGLLLFTSSAATYMENNFFLIKMLLIAAAGVNMGVFHFVTWKNVHEWDVSPAPPNAAKVAGGLSLLFWILVVGFGRWIGFA